MPRHEREGVCKLFSPNLPLPRIEARAQVTRSTGRGGEGEKKMKRRRLCASDDNRRLSAIRFFAFDGTPSFPFFASASPNKFNWLSASTDKYFCAEWVRSNKLERRDLTLIFIRYFFFSLAHYFIKIVRRWRNARAQRKKKNEKKRESLPTPRRPQLFRVGRVFRTKRCKIE